MTADGLKVKVTVKAFYDRPSGHRLSPGFTPETQRLCHDETIGCRHSKEHALQLLHFLDALSTDCGIKDGEFKDIEGWSQKFAELMDVVWKMSRDKTEFTELGMRPCCGQGRNQARPVCQRRDGPGMEAERERNQGPREAAPRVALGQVIQP
ncbi:MAG: hypothetical protein JRN45_00700 [Nitrososphaerota archaeon]|nr:hypothetical protein [Nitrososphaerota archaeon]